MKIKNKFGFSFIEMLVVLLISTAAFAGIYSTFIVGNKAWKLYNDSVAVKKEARRALLSMVNELREAQNVKVIHSTHGIALHFFRPSVGTVSYFWSSKGDNANRIMRHSRKGMKIMAQYISKLSFLYTKNTIYIDIAAGKNSTENDSERVSLREKVALRSQTKLFR